MKCSTVQNAVLLDALCHRSSRTGAARASDKIGYFQRWKGGLRIIAKGRVFVLGILGILKYVSHQSNTVGSASASLCSALR
jgi:hypothetical protein